MSKLRTENAILELKISESDKRNKILQLQIDIMMKKMEILEGFMTQVKQIDDDGKNEDSPGEIKHQKKPICRKCKKYIDKWSPENKSSSLESSDTEDVDVQELMHLWGPDYIDNESDNFQNPFVIDVASFQNRLPITFPSHYHK